MAETVYLGHDNYFSRELKDDGTALTANEMSAITKIKLVIGGTTIQRTSATNATGSIRWSQDGYDTAEVRFHLGDESLTVAGSPYTAYLTIYDAVNTDGIFWDSFEVAVADESEPTSILVIEDGSQATPTAANSFVTVAEADTYHFNRGNGTWAVASTKAKEQALVRAGQYLNAFWWKGAKVLQKQALCLPRVRLWDGDGYLFDYTEIPQQAKHAQCEAALLELTANTLQPNLTRGGKVKRKKTDVLETEYFSGAPSRTTFTKISGLLKGLVKSSGSIEIVRS